MPAAKGKPALSGIHDLESILGVCQHFNVPAMVRINKYNVNEENARRVEDYCQSQGIETVSRIPYDNVVTEAMIKDVPVVEYRRNSVAHEIVTMWEKMAQLL